MITMILSLGVAGLLTWAAWTKKYTQAFLLITPLFGIYSCIVGVWVIHQGNAWPGVLLMALGLGALVHANKHSGKA